MSDKPEVKLCPWPGCGKHGTWWFNQNKVSCSDSKCPASTVSVSREDWNRRPEVDARDAARGAGWTFENEPGEIALARQALESSRRDGSAFSRGAVLHLLECLDRAIYAAVAYRTHRQDGEVLREALAPLMDYLEKREAAGFKHLGESIHGIEGRAGSAEITVDHLRAIRAALALRGREGAADPATVFGMPLPGWVYDGTNGWRYVGHQTASGGTSADHLVFQSEETSAPVAPTPWQPMETADPKETILMMYQGGFIGSGKKDTGIRNGATHWMPLPVAPSPALNEGGE